MDQKNFNIKNYDFDLSKVEKLTDFGHICVQNWAKRMKLMHEIGKYIKGTQHHQKFSPDYLLIGVFQILQDDYHGVNPVVFNLKDETKFAPIFVFEYDEQHILIMDGLRKEQQIKLKSEI
jgi:hypothetical protein